MADKKINGSLEITGVLNPNSSGFGFNLPSTSSLTADKTIATSDTIKTLKTNNTDAQSTSSDESIAGSGTINLHKISKTGSFWDIIDRPSTYTTHTITLTLTNATPTVDGDNQYSGKICFDFYDQESSPLSDISDVLSTLSYYDQVRPATGYITTGNTKYIVYRIVGSSNFLKISVFNASTFSSTTLSLYPSYGGTWSVYDSSDYSAFALWPEYNV